MLSKFPTNHKMLILLLLVYFISSFQDTFLSYIFLISFILFCACVGGECCIICVEAKDNLQELVLSYYVIPRDPTQIIRLGIKYLLAHLSSGNLFCRQYFILPDLVCSNEIINN